MTIPNGWRKLSEDEVIQFGDLYIQCDSHIGACSAAVGTKKCESFEDYVIIIRNCAIEERDEWKRKYEELVYNRGIKMDIKEHNEERKT